jgi:hypothetical protein
MPQSAGEFNRIWMSCLWVMVMFIAEVTMWLTVFLMHDLIGHLNTGGHYNNNQKSKGKKGGGLVS